LLKIVSFGFARRLPFYDKKDSSCSQGFPPRAPTVPSRYLPVGANGSGRQR
jgi:hypothetical protein